MEEVEAQQDLPRSWLLKCAKYEAMSAMEMLVAGCSADAGYVAAAAARHGTRAGFQLINTVSPSTSPDDGHKW